MQVVTLNVTLVKTNWFIKNAFFCKKIKPHNNTFANANGLIGFAPLSRWERGAFDSARIKVIALTA